MTLERIKEFKDLKIGDYIICVTRGRGIKNLSDVDRKSYMYIEKVTHLKPQTHTYRSHIFTTMGKLSDDDTEWIFDTNIFYRISEEIFFALII